MDLDIKGVTAKMEQGNGCALLSSEAFQSFNKDYKAQLALVKQIQAESSKEAKNTLSFDWVNDTDKDMKGNTVDIVGVNVNSTLKPVPIVQEFASIDHNSQKVYGVAKTCHY